MKDAKYRAWDGETFYHIDLNNAEELIETMPGYLRTGLELQPKQFFIGIKDKNDKDIYDGDIISGTFPMMVVGYNSECGAFGASKSLDFSTENMYWFNGDIDIKHDAWVVIGNIYENPELLTQQTTQ